MENSLEREFKDLDYEEFDAMDRIPYNIIDPWDPGLVKDITRKNGPLHPQLVVKLILPPDKEPDRNQRMEFDDTSKRSILREAMCLKHARHRHVVMFQRAFLLNDNRMSKSFMGIVMNHAEGNIGSYLRCQRSTQELGAICGWFRCLANVVAYVHGLGITHRDIKPPNILVKNGRVLLADFGISKMGLVKTIPTTQLHAPRAHTIRYAAPEVEDGSTRGRSADIFSLGVVFLEMVVAHSYPARRGQLGDIMPSKAEPSFSTKLGGVRRWMKERLLEEGQGMTWSQRIIQICLDMMNIDRDERPTIDNVYLEIQSAHIPNQPECCANMLGVEDVTNDQKLLEACKMGNGDEVRDLVDREGVSPGTVGALHQASAHGFSDIVEYLISRGADVNLKDFSNQIALHCAAGYGHKSVVDILLEKSDVHLKDVYGRTPLFYACGHGNLEIVSRLFDHQADASVQDDDGQTALHFAAKGAKRPTSNHEKIIRLLLEKHADVNASDRKGKTPRDYAKLKNYYCRVKLLRGKWWNLRD
ncbi:ankyrin repeat-containing domain protein [Annulohypoxylon maeteangense]|uniref:ankyrin repeat-containing domain protein n=1 Tax=Annulohypoxylon maeteangense TaxID=1927788 RepID=UPI00200784C8|nr:ankyrin repeat-containing domain protein [Annulohypoxylon maeteangense]KAI0880260.1 ankyrin repeat-containing domain protein [Annulohypoxylon maeteangense]